MPGATDIFGCRLLLSLLLYLSMLQLPLNLTDSIKNGQHRHVHSRILDNVFVELIQFLAALCPVGPGFDLDLAAKSLVNAEASGEHFYN